MTINNYTLWCRECGTTWEDIDAEGVCRKCDTENILKVHHIAILVPIEAFSQEEAKARVSVIVNKLINEETLPSNSAVW